MEFKFIVFEGGDGSGKTSLSNLLCQKLIENGNKVWKTAEPQRETPIGKIINEMIKSENPDEKTLYHLFMADRYQHLIEIQNHINNGEIVVCDRFVLSTMVYQNSMSHYALNELLADFPITPDVWFICSTNDLTRVEKRGLSKDSYESSIEKIKHYNWLYNSVIQEVSPKHRNRMIGMNTDGDISEVQQKFLNNCQKIGLL